MTDYKNILVAVDFSDAANTVIERALDVAQRNHTQFTLLHVVEYLPPMDIAYEPVMTSSWAVDEEALVKQASDSLHKLCEKRQLQDVTPVVVVGAAKYEICEYAREHGCDLIIMGAHGRHGIRLLLGSTANGVLHEMPCDVMAVKIAE
ncbi:MAG: universal stress protein [Gammaproteobacteria bacterium]|nr:universal stress protein [Gammaproteobacteria bacterium]